MKILVANLGSTSFKYRLFDMRDERQLARGGTERIGSQESRSFVEIGDHRAEAIAPVADHAAAVRTCLAHLTDAAHGCLRSASEVSAIGFKAVQGGRFSGTQRVSPELLASMETMNEVAPAHNPPYIAAMRALAERLPEIPLVAAFETGFHETIPDRNRYYAVPWRWIEEYQVRRWGYHGASHRYIAGRAAELLGRGDLRIISCHLGGSSSLCAIRNGQSQANSLGMSPQSGLPHNNRAGDLDPYALSVVMARSGRGFGELLAEAASQGGLLGLSGLSSDVRDLEHAAAAGNARAKLALDVFVGSIRQYLGAYLVELGGADLIVFTGGIGENSVAIRRAVCAGLEAFGIELDGELNQVARGEARLHNDRARVQVWTIPTNEEIVVARQTQALLTRSASEG
jgi:acetate kinase